MTLPNRNEAEAFVSALYLGVLRRKPDEAGHAQFVNSLLRGRTYASVAEEFVTCEEFKAQSAIKLFVPPGHFYSPIVDPVEADRHLAALEAVTTPEFIRGINVDRPGMIETWRRLLPFLTSIPFTESVTHPSHYAFDNPFYSFGDGSILHAILLHYRPKRVIEVGCGWSSACIFDTVDKYLEDPCKLTFIEPDLSNLRDILGDAAGHVEIIEKRVQNVPLEVFNTLESGDILLIDSTHILRTGSDVCFELFEILPRLACGVLVHIHDIFWPFEYPRSWAVDDNRSWNELYAVRAFLTNNDAWRIVMFNDYLAKLEREMIEATYPAFLRNSGGALWLQRK